MVNKGSQTKIMTIMGKGRTGFGYRRQSHVVIKVEVIDFAKKIKDAKSLNQKRVWTERRDSVKNLKAAYEQVAAKIENMVNAQEAASS